MELPGSFASSWLKRQNRSQPRRREKNLEAQTQPESELPFIRHSARDNKEVARIAGVSTRVIEVGRVGEVECFRAELQVEPFSQWKFAEERKVEIGQSRPAQEVATGVAESNVSDRAERRGIVKRLSRPDPSQFLDRSHLIGRLGIARSVERSARGGHVEWPSLNRTPDTIELPPLDQLFGQAVAILPERKLADKSELEHVRDIETSLGTIAVQDGRMVERQPGPAVIIRPVNSFRVGIGAFQEQPFS